MDRYDLVIRNATVIDGTRAPRYQADIGVSGGKIKAIGRLETGADVEIDASGKVAAPGFIDSHTHDDRLMLSAPDMTPKVSQGVTTVIAGNCGCSLAPAPNGMSAPVTPPLDLLDEEGKWFRFARFADYVAELEAKPAATNCALLVGHTMLRLQTMDNLERAANKNEIGRMRELADEALKCRDARLIVGQHIRGSRVAVEPAGLVLGDPDLNQVTADAVALGEGVGRLSAQELLDDLPLELDRMRAVLSHGLSPRKPGSVSRFSGPLPVHPKGCTPIGGQTEG